MCICMAYHDLNGTSVYRRNRFCMLARSTPGGGRKRADIVVVVGWKSCYSGTFLPPFFVCIFILK